MRTAAMVRLQLAVCGLGILCAQPQAETRGGSPAGKRAFEIEDLFRDQFAYGYASPDGSVLAFYRSIGLADQMRRMGDVRNFRDRRDYWLYWAKSDRITKLFTAGEDRLDLCDVYWSPDGRFLVLRTGSGIRYRFQVWDRATGKKTPVGPWLIYSRAEIVLRKPRWVSNTRLAVLAPSQPADAVDPRMDVPVQAVIAGWVERERGVKSTASVLNSGLASNETSDRGQLLLIDAERKTLTVVAKGDPAGVAASPDGTRFAFQQTGGRARLNPDDTFPAWLGPEAGGMVDSRKVMIEDLSSGKPPFAIPGAEHAIRDIGEDALQWSPDGAQLAYLNGATARAQPDIQIYSMAAAATVTAKFDTASRPAFKAADMKWLYPHQLLVSTSTAGKPRRWNLVASDGAVRELPAKQTIPARIYPESKSTTFLFLNDSQLWRYDLARESETCLSCKASLAIASIASATADSMIVTAKGPEGDGDYLFRADSGEFRRLKLPTNTGKFEYLRYDLKTGASLLAARTASVTTLMAANIFDGGQKAIATADNSYRDQIDRGEVRLIDYRGADGQPLKANLLLPRGYEPGKRYPTVVSVYPGDVWTGADRFLNGLLMFPISKLWLSVNGYAVLEPSLPLPGGAGPKDHYKELTKGVLPAVDKLIEMGIADPDRLAVIGHSYGGYAVYGLITQTDRFKAAIAGAGTSDLLSGYGEFVPLDRYSSQADQGGRNAEWSEGGQAQLHATPWSDLQRYIRNSPLIYADRVHTPILIVQGDQDYVPIQQGEEFYSAMVRLRRPARFVRYWGEEHTPTTPANIRDLHRQILDWLDLWLKPNAQAKPPLN